MKLSESDLTLLREWGEREDDIEYIKKMFPRMRYYRYNPTTNDEERITAEQAYELLGQKIFMSGIDRATYHRSASRHPGNDQYKRPVSFVAGWW